MGPPARLFRQKRRRAHALCNISVNKKRAGNFEILSTITIGTLLKFYRKIFLVLLHHTKHIDFKRIEQKLYVKFNKIMFLRFLSCLIYQREAGQNILKSVDHIFALCLCFCLLGSRTVNSGSKPRSDDLSSTNINISPYIWWQYVGLLWFLKFHTMNKRMEKSVHDYPNC